MPYYKITQKQLDAAKRLVKAKNAATAMKHLTEQLFAMEIATTDDVAAMMSQGVKPEEAK